LIALIDRGERKGRWGGGRAWRGSRGGAGSGGGAAGGRRKERGKGEADRRAPVVSAAGEKRKREEERSGPAREAGWAAWAEREQALVFFSFSFSNFIFKPIFNSNSNQTFQTFSQEFYKLFRNLSSNQKPCKPADDSQTLVVSKLFKLYLIF
jgi:hypothetical protein